MKTEERGGRHKKQSRRKSSNCKEKSQTNRRTAEMYGYTPPKQAVSDNQDEEWAKLAPVWALGIGGARPSICQERISKSCSKEMYGYTPPKQAVSDNQDEEWAKLAPVWALGIGGSRQEKGS